MERDMKNDYELLSDLHKDARGYRPTVAYMTWFKSLSDEQKNTEWNQHCVVLAANTVLEAEIADQSLAEYNTRILNMMNQFGIDRMTAIRWDMDAHEVDITDALLSYGTAHQAVEHYLWENGLSFDNIDRMALEILEANVLT
jgi:hypothetical protein